MQTFVDWTNQLTLDLFSGGDRPRHWRCREERRPAWCWWNVRRTVAASPEFIVHLEGVHRANRLAACCTDPYTAALARYSAVVRELACGATCVSFQGCS